MSTDNICNKSCSEEKINSTPRYVNVFKNVTSFPYYEKKYCKNEDKPVKEDLLNKLKKLKPKCNSKVLADDCSGDLSLKKVVNSEGSILPRNKLPHKERSKRNLEKRAKSSRRGGIFYNRGTEVLEQLNESSRLSKKMQCNCYDHSQGKHYSKGYFEKFPYASGVTSLEAMSSCSSLDVSVYRMKKQEENPSRREYKKNSDKLRANRKGCKLSCTSLIVNYSPKSNYDFCDKRKMTDFKGDKRNLNNQCLTKSNYSNNEKGKDSSSLKTYDCCCADEDKVKSGCAYYCRCPGYTEDLVNYENYSDFKPRFSATPFRENDKRNVAKRNTADDKFVKCPDYKDENEKVDIKFSDLTPDVPFPTHWSQCGQHISNVANEYRHLLKNFKSVQSQAEDPCRKKSRKKFTRTYPSGKEFTFEVKPAKDEFKSKLTSRCECKNCPELVKSLKNVQFCEHSKGSVILDSYNNLVKSLGDKRTTKKCKNNKSKDIRNVKNCRSNLEKDSCGCACKKRNQDGSFEDKYAKMLKNKDQKFNQKLNHCSQNLNKCAQKLDVCKASTDRSEKLTSKSRKLTTKCQTLNTKNQILNPKGQMLNPKTDKLPSTCQELSKKNQELNEFNFPRIVKPRGASCKVDLKKILVYPPHGEEGPPLSLYKKCSNIDCRIKGDVSKGFRYKVTYKQEFLSPVWHPEKKGNPFRRKENTTDYG